MSWRYLAARETIRGEEEWTIREVYEGTDWSGWSSNDAAPSGSTLEELREDLRRMLLDIEHRDFLDLDTGQVAHRSGGGMRSYRVRPGRKGAES